jgi:hypothetical protein
MMYELPPDPGPVIEPHSLFVYGQRPDGVILVACADCDGAIIGIAPDAEEALGVAHKHGLIKRGEA